MQAGYGAGRGLFRRAHCGGGPITPRASGWRLRMDGFCVSTDILGHGAAAVVLGQLGLGTGDCGCAAAKLGRGTMRLQEREKCNEEEMQKKKGKSSSSRSSRARTG
jgi:hypothetical protein